MPITRRLFTTVSPLFVAGGVRADGAAATPGLRSQPSLVWSESLGELLLVDGSYPAVQPEFTELWSWNGKRWMADAGAAGPRGRYASAAVFDDRRRRLVSYGGRVGRPERVLGDTWEWDGVHWFDRGHEGPGARDHVMMAFDSRRGRTVLYGGGRYPRTTPWARDTWERDGAAWRLASDEGPVGRIGVLVYDAARRQVVLFGGVGEAAARGEPQPNFGDTWAWDGKEWWLLSNDGPAARDRHAMAFDAAAGVVLLYGGSTRAGSFGDLWAWDGKRWREIQMRGDTPGKRALHAIGYDPRRRRMVLYGGNAGGTVVGDTWEWDGGRWAQVA